MQLLHAPHCDMCKPKAPKGTPFFERHKDQMALKILSDLIWDHFSVSGATTLLQVDWRFFDHNIWVLEPWGIKPMSHHVIPKKVA